MYRFSFCTADEYDVAFISISVLMAIIVSEYSNIIDFSLIPFAVCSLFNVHIHSVLSRNIIDCH